MPELRQLRVFVAVAEERNFTRAGERLHLGQQGVSKTVGQLERELGVALLERTTREVRLTPAGAELLASGRDVLAAADAAFARAQGVGRGLAGTVRIGVSPAVGPAVREQVVAVLREGAPELAVSFHEVRPGTVAALLRDRAVDLVLARTTSAGPEVDSVALRPSPAVLCVAVGHPLAAAAAAGPVPLAALNGERLVVWNPPGTPFTDLLLARLTTAGARVVPVESHVTGASEPPDVTGGDGTVAIVPAGSPRRDGTVHVPIADGLALPLLVLWAAGPPPPAVTRLRAALEDL